MDLRSKGDFANMQTLSETCKSNVNVSCFNRMPSERGWYPEVGNGQLATVIYSHTIYMNGLYNGHKIGSHRARIPSPASVTIKYVNRKQRTNTYSLDLGEGEFMLKEMDNRNFKVSLMLCKT